MTAVRGPNKADTGRWTGPVAKLKKSSIHSCGSVPDAG